MNLQIPLDSVQIMEGYYDELIVVFVLLQELRDGICRPTGPAPGTERVGV